MKVKKGGDTLQEIKIDNRHLHPIDRRLKELGYNRTWLARKIGKTPQCIGLYCNKRRPVTADSGFANLVCKALAVDIDYLIMGRAAFAQIPAETKKKPVKNGKARQY